MRNLVLKALFAGLLSGALALFLNAINPWGLNAAMGRAAQNVIQRLTVDSYPHGLTKSAPLPGEDITVISIDEAGVSALADVGWPATWPPGLNNLSQMILDVAVNAMPEDAAAAKERPASTAKAVFVDFWIDGPDELRLGQTPTEEHEAFNTFITDMEGLTRADRWRDIPACRTDPASQIACILAAGGTPIVMARPRTVRTHSSDSRPLATPPNIARMESTVVLAPITVDELGTRLIQGADVADGRFHLAPPAAMWLADCLADIKQNLPCPLPHAAKFLAKAEAAMKHQPDPWPDYRPEQVLGAFWDDPIVVVWSRRRPHEQAILVAQTTSARGPDCVASRPWLQQIRHAFTDKLDDKGPGRSCLPHMSLEYDRLVAGMGVDSQSQNRLLNNRLVFLGGHFDGADWISTPIHGRAPGVHWHAMALDNLLSKGADYRRGDGGFWSLGTLYEVAGVVLFSSMTFFLVGLATGKTTGSPTQASLKRRGFVAVAGVAVCLTAAASILALTHLVWWREPINWIAILGLCFVTAIGLVEGVFNGRIRLFYQRNLRKPLLGLADRLIPWGRRFDDHSEPQDTDPPTPHPPVATPSVTTAPPPTS